jgi:hypothetical protein
MVSALPPQVSVAVFGTKMATYGHLLLALSKIINFLEGFEFKKFGMERVKGLMRKWKSQFLK